MKNNLKNNNNEEEIMETTKLNINKAELALKGAKKAIDEVYECWATLDPHETDYNSWWKAYTIGWQLFLLGVDCLAVTTKCYEQASNFAPTEECNEYHKIYHENLEKYRQQQKNKIEI